MEFKKNDIVVLNERGKQCYERNKNNKHIKPTSIMRIVKSHGFDNQREIYDVKSVETEDKENDNDYYFGECLEK